jgi:hypothetical protein
MNQFFKDANLVWLIGIVSAAFGGLWAFYRFVYEKKLERFNTAALNIFSNDEDKVLAAVANLGVFKRDFLFQKITTDVLLTRLYKELNYNITNAIANALVRFSNRRDLLVIADRILDINRNFSFQTYPYNQIVADFKFHFDEVNQVKSFAPNKIAQEVIDKRVQQYAEEFIDFQEKLDYEIRWHQQITAETYAHIVSGMGAFKMSPSVIVFDYIKQVLFKWDFKFYNRKIPLRLYQNCCGNILLVRFKTNHCSISRSDFTTTTFADVDFNNIDIYDCCFNRARIDDCKFTEGRIAQGLIMDTEFGHVSFTNICFENIFFTGCSFKNCAFEGCEGLNEFNFYGAEIDDKTKQSLPDGIKQKLESIKFIEAYNEVQNSTLLNDDKNLITERQSQKIKSVEDIETVSRSSIERGMKDKILLAASANFKFNEIFDPVCSMELTEIQKLDLLRLLVQNKPVEDFIVEWYDTHLGEKQIVILPYIKPEITSATYTDQVKQSKLLDFEKNALLVQLDTLFKPEAETKKKKTRQPKLKVDEKTGEVDQNQLLQ